MSMTERILSNPSAISFFRAGMLMESSRSAAVKAGDRPKNRNRALKLFRLFKFLIYLKIRRSSPTASMLSNMSLTSTLMEDLRDLERRLMQAKMAGSRALDRFLAGPSFCGSACLNKQKELILAIL